MSPTLIIWIVFFVLAALFVIPYVRRIMAKEQAVLEAHQESLDYGLFSPASLHPIVNPDQCIGTGNCVEACPEKDVLGLLSGQAMPVSPARCIGHGLCERSCPVNAIELVFGTSKRGVDLPRLQENFETNVPGLFVVGELGGMGLIRNAFEQGRQCIELLKLKPVPKDSGELDLAIIGCGPAGLSCALFASEKGYSYLVLEKDGIGGTVLNYPRKKLVMTAPLILPGPFSLMEREYFKEDLLEIWKGLVDEFKLHIKEHEIVHSIEKSATGLFEVKSSSGVIKARNVVLAIGRRGIPRKLGVVGEQLPNVAYSLKDARHYEGDRCLVVGGGDSAVEAALSLSEEMGTTVYISYRQDQFSRIKKDNLDRLKSAISTGAILPFMRSNVLEIKNSEVILSLSDGETQSVPNDFVFIFAGGTLPTEFLQNCGIKIDTVFGSKNRKTKTN